MQEKNTDDKIRMWRLFFTDWQIWYLTCHYKDRGCMNPLYNLCAMCNLSV